MIEHRVKVRVVDWTDRAFAEALQIALSEACCAVDLDCPEAATLAQTVLRRAGYPDAEVHYERSYAELLQGRAQWTVHRDGSGQAARPALAAADLPAAMSPVRLGGGLNPR